jgi:hypothetical protein
VAGGGVVAGGWVTVWVWVTVLVLVLTLTDVDGVVVVVLGVVVVVVVGSVVVVVVVVGSVVDVVSEVPVSDDVTAGADVVVTGVSEGAGASSGDDPPVIALARPYTINAMSRAPTAPMATSAAGRRYQGTSAGGSG